MVADISGLSKSRRDLRRLPINNSAGAIPADEWGVILYLNKNFASFSFNDPPDICLRLCLNVCTALSASPFVEE